MILIWIALFSLIYVILYRQFKRPTNFPPGPLFLPFIGTLYTVPSQTSHNAAEEWRKQYGNIIGHKLGPNLAVFICGADILKAFKHSSFQGRLESSTFYQRTYNKKLGLFLNDGENWFELRRFVLGFIGQFYGKKLEAIMIEEMANVLATTETGKPILMDHGYIQVSLNMILRILVNESGTCNTENYNQLRSHISKAFEYGRNTGIEIYYPIFKHFFQNYVQQDAARYRHKFLTEYLEDHKKTLSVDNPRDLMDAFLIEYNQQKNIIGVDSIYNDEGLLSCCVDLIDAGNESVGHTIKFIFLYLSLNPSAQEKLHEELDTVVGRNRVPSLEDKKNMPYVEAVLEETFRINPIAPLAVVHKSTENTTFGNYKIPKDTLIYCSIWSLHYDEDIWNEPSKFIPERHLNNGKFAKSPYVVPFGLGKHACLGEILSRNIIFLYITSFFQNYSIQFPPGETPSTVAMPGFTVSPQPFNIIIQKR